LFVFNFKCCEYSRKFVSIWIWACNITSQWILSILATNASMSIDDFDVIFRRWISLSTVRLAQSNNETNPHRQEPCFGRSNCSPWDSNNVINVSKFRRTNVTIVVGRDALLLQSRTCVRSTCAFVCGKDSVCGELYKCINGRGNGTGLRDFATTPTDLASYKLHFTLHCDNNHWSIETLKVLVRSKFYRSDKSLLRTTNTILPIVQY